MGFQAAGVIYLRRVRRRAVDHHPHSRIHQSPEKLSFCIWRSAIPVNCASMAKLLGQMLSLGDDCKRGVLPEQVGGVDDLLRLFQP